MMDLARKKGIEIDVAGLELELGVPVIPVNPRKNKGMAQLKKSLAATAKIHFIPSIRDFIANKELAPAAVEGVKFHYPKLSDYSALHYLINHENFPLPDPMQETIEQIEIDNKFNSTKTQAEEIMQRYTRIKRLCRRQW